MVSYSDRLTLQVTISRWSLVNSPKFLSAVCQDTDTLHTVLKGTLCKSSIITPLDGATEDQQKMLTVRRNYHNCFSLHPNFFFKNKSENNYILWIPLLWNHNSMFSNKVEVYLRFILHAGVALLSKKGHVSRCHQRLLEVFEHLYHVLQPVHAVPEDDPVPHVSVRRVTYVA